MTPRWIGYSEVHAKYCAISRNTYLAMAREGIWGPTAAIRGMVMVSEAAVKRWADTPGQTTRELVREHLKQSARPSNGSSAAVVEGKESRAEVGDAALKPTIARRRGLVNSGASA